MKKYSDNHNLKIYTNHCFMLYEFGYEYVFESMISLETQKLFHRPFSGMSKSFKKLIVSCGDCQF